MKRFVCRLLFCIFLSGSILYVNKNKDILFADTALVTESSLPVGDQEETENLWKESETSKDNLQKFSAFTNEEKAEMMRKQQNLYGFTMLDITEQNVYVEILYALENYVDEMEISTTKTDVIDKIFQYVLMDHPEIFYTDGYSFVKYTLGDEIQKITFKGTYIYNQEEKKNKEILIESAAVKMLQRLKEDATDYEKVKYVYEAIIENTEYDMEAEDNQNICSVFLGQASVCQGYAKAVQYLLTQLDVPATMVTGTVDNGEGHAWNLVKINNAYYYLDATWGDASYLFRVQEEQEIQNAPSINYDYLCVTTEEILRTHSFSDLVPLPQCNTMENNYYVREGAYFTEMDYEQLQQLIQTYQNEGRESMTLRCSGQNVYENMVEELVNQQKIFQYLTGENNSILYTDAPKQLSITFWL